MATDEQRRLDIDLAPRVTESQRVRADQLIQGLAERRLHARAPDPGEGGVAADVWRDTCHEVAGDALLVGLRALTVGEAAV